MKASLDQGRPVRVAEHATLADSLCGGIGLTNRLTFELCRSLLDDVVLVGEEEIADAMRHAYRNEREVLEGAGAIGISALLANRIPGIQGPVAVVLSGRNVDMDRHHEIVGVTSRRVADERAPCH